MSLKSPRSVQYHMHKCSLYRFRIVYLSGAAYGCQRYWVEVWFCYSFCCCCGCCCWIFCISFLFIGFDWYSYRLRLRLTSFAMQLRQARTKSGSYLLQACACWHRSLAWFWPTRIKYIYLMHLQNIDDVRDCLSFWNLLGSLVGSMATEHLTQAPTRRSAIAMEPATEPGLSSVHFLRLYDISPWIYIEFQ